MTEMTDIEKHEWIEIINKVYAADERITAHLAEDTVDKSDLSTDEYIEWIAEEILKELKNSAI